MPAAVTARPMATTPAPPGRPPATGLAIPLVNGEESGHGMGQYIRGKSEAVRSGGYGEAAGSAAAGVRDTLRRESVKWAGGGAFRRGSDGPGPNPGQYLLASPRSVNIGTVNYSWQFVADVEEFIQ